MVAAEIIDYLRKKRANEGHHLDRLIQEVAKASASPFSLSLPHRLSDVVEDLPEDLHGCQLVTCRIVGGSGETRRAFAVDHGAASSNVFSLVKLTSAFPCAIPSGRQRRGQFLAPQWQQKTTGNVNHSVEKRHWESADCPAPSGSYRWERICPGDHLSFGTRNVFYLSRSSLYCSRIFRLSIFPATLLGNDSMITTS